MQLFGAHSPVMSMHTSDGEHCACEHAETHCMTHLTILEAESQYPLKCCPACLAEARAQESGPTAGLDVPFYSRITDTLGLRYETHGWTFDVSTTHQSSQFSDVTNTVNETPDARVGRIPGFRVWNMQADWKIPGWKGSNLTLGVNNIADKRYYTRNVDGNAGRMVGAPRLIYVQGHFVY